MRAPCVLAAVLQNPCATSELTHWTKTASAYVPLRKSQHDPEITTFYFRCKKGYRNMVSLQSTYLYLQKHTGSRVFPQEPEWKIESSSTLSMKIALVIISGRVTVLLLFGDRVGGKSACRRPCISSPCPWWKSVPFGNPLRGTSGGWIQAVKTRARELQSCSTEGLAWTNRPQRSREQYRISAATRPLHQNGFASGQSLVQPGSEGSVLQSKACSAGSNWQKSPEYYLVIRRGEGERTFSGILRLQEVLGQWT